MIASKLPSVLTFPGTVQSSLPMEVALKAIIELLESFPGTDQLDERTNDQLDAALDNLQLMLKAIDRS